MVNHFLNMPQPRSATNVYASTSFNKTLANNRRFHLSMDMWQKNVLTGRKRAMLGNQAFEVLQSLKWTILQFMWYLSRISLVCRIAAIWITSFLKSLNRGIPGLKFWQYLCIKNISIIRKLFNFGEEVCLTAVELQMFGYQAWHVCTQFEHSFAATCPHLDENDGF